MNNNPIDCRSDLEVTKTDSGPTLVEIAARLAEPNPGDESSALSDGKPEVVFVGQTETAPVVNSHSTEDIKATVADLPDWEPEYPTRPGTEFAREENDREGLLTVDPFSQEVNGQIPAMPTLPVISPEQLTRKVIEREASGDHHAWRLLAHRPIQSQHHGESERAANGFVDDATEVVAVQDSAESDDDCFYAHPGQVISVDGNQGFDHIDLRSYSIEEATFEPGAIVLHACAEPMHSMHADSVTQSITIRHSGVDFAVFNGEIRVDL